MRPGPKRKKHFKISWVHLEALLLLVVYLAFSKLNLLAALLSPNWWVIFGYPYLYGCLAGLIFLYLFSHEDFFPVAKEIEKKEKKEEQKWQRRLVHHGKVFICFTIGTFSSPILGALAVRLLIHKHSFWFKYLIIVISEVFSTALTVGLFKGLSHLAF